MQLSTETLPQYFTIATPENSHYTQPTNCFDFVDRNSQQLLVTIGESWTYGSELHNRLEQTFGGVISLHYHWDWLNLGLPGSSNFYIASKVEELAKLSCSLKYKKIIVCCLFTEIGRGFNSHEDMHIDYRNWLDNNITKSDDFYKLLMMMNQDCVDRILKASQDKFTVIFGSNFVHALGLPQDKTVPKTWFEILNIQCPATTYTGTTGANRFTQLIDFLTNDQKLLYKAWFPEIVSRAKYADDICFKICSDHVSHPNAAQHRKWAEYLIEYIDQNGIQ